VSAEHYVYKLIPPRPTFATDMSDSERRLMGEHVGYWTALKGCGSVVVFGPVADPAGSWRLAVVEAASEDEVRALGAEDPAVTSGMASFEVYRMPLAIVR
jgi:uncharacterized protein YciI